MHYKDYFNYGVFYDNSHASREYRDAILDFHSAGYIPEFRHDYRLIAVDGEVYDPVEGPLARENGEFVTLEDVEHTREH